MTEVNPRLFPTIVLVLHNCEPSQEGKKYFGLENITRSEALTAIQKCKVGDMILTKG